MAASQDKPQRRRRGHGEGSITQYKDGRWVARLDLGYVPRRDADGQIMYADERVVYVRKRKVIYGKTRKEVADKLKTELAAQQAGVNIAPDRQTVAAYREHWLTTSVEPQTRPGTATKYRQWVRLYVAPALGRVQLAKLTPQQVQTFLRDTQRGTAHHKGLSAGSVRRMLGMLRVALNVALKYDLVSRNVAKLVDAPRVEPYEPQILTFADAERLLTAAASHRLHALWLAALTLGLREGELLGLRWSDVSLEAALLHVNVQLVKVNGGLVLMPPKTPRSRRTLPVPPELVTALRQHHARQLQERILAGSRWQERDLVFPTTIGTPQYATNMLLAFKGVLKEAELSHMRFHDLRHSCSTFLAALGVDIKTAMEILGHTNAQMTLHYTHALDENKTAAVARIGKRFGGTEETGS